MVYGGRSYRAVQERIGRIVNCTFVEFELSHELSSVVFVVGISCMCNDSLRLLLTT
jgi:hypothetical protein